jgi:hypothetical protein
MIPEFGDVNLESESISKIASILEAIAAAKGIELNLPDKNTWARYLGESEFTSYLSEFTQNLARDTNNPHRCYPLTTVRHHDYQYHARQKTYPPGSRRIHWGGSAHYGELAQYRPGKNPFYKVGRKKTIYLQSDLDTYLASVRQSA